MNSAMWLGVYAHIAALLLPVVGSAEIVSKGRRKVATALGDQKATL